MSAYLNIFKKVVKTKTGRTILLRKFDKLLYRKVVKENQELPKSIRLKKYNIAKATVEGINRNYEKGLISEHVLDRTIDTLIKFSYTDRELREETKEEFKKKYGILPPTFITFAPSQKCNLQCIGCYASSHENCPTLPFEVVEKVVDELYNEWGNRFMTVTGGEPFMYKDKGKTLFDIYEKYPEMFFLVYTNGTLITKEVAKKLAKLGNVTPAISLEGWEKETDERRGKGVYKKILKSMKNLREAGVLFGVSITSTKENVDILLDNKFYEFLFEEQGASYMWQFQLMPIGRGSQVKELMISPEQRVKLYRKWEEMIERGYAIADFWNSGVLSNGCIAYGRHGGYLYVDWNGNIMPCVFVPYYENNILQLHKQGKKLADALFSDLFVNGRKWQQEYGLSCTKSPDNWLMPCSIRDHYKNFKTNILTKNTKPEDSAAGEALASQEYEKILTDFDTELEKLTVPIWKNEYKE